MGQAERITVKMMMSIFKAERRMGKGAEIFRDSGRRPAGMHFALIISSLEMLTRKKIAVRSKGNGLCRLASSFSALQAVEKM
jgi:hypothetical protein